MESVNVPQHLELDDVLAFGIGAIDLVVLGASGLIAAWLYVRAGLLPISLRVGLGLMLVGAGTVLGPARFGGRPVREIALAAVEFVRRPRRRIYAGDA